MKFIHNIMDSYKFIRALFSLKRNKLSTHDTGAGLYKQMPFGMTTPLYMYTSGEIDANTIYIIYQGYSVQVCQMRSIYK